MVIRPTNALMAKIVHFGVPTAKIESDTFRCCKYEIDGYNKYKYKNAFYAAKNSVLRRFA